MFGTPVMDLNGEASFLSTGVSFSGGCEAELMNLYNQTYFSLLKQSCGSCHTNGPGIGQFGHPDFTTSYNAFKSMTRSSINRNLINAAHQPPFTGAQHQPALDSFTPRWVAAETTYGVCTGNAVAGNGITTLGKTNPAIVAAAANPNTWTRITWDLAAELKDAALNGKIPLTASIEARVATVNGVRQGYEFRNPMVRINTGFTGPYRITSMRIHINNVLQQNVTTYSAIDFSVSTNTDVNISPNTAFALAVLPMVESTDSFALEFGDIKSAAGGSVGNPGGGGTPAPTPTLPTTVTLAQLLSNDAMLGVFRQSCVGCHSPGNVKGNLDITNPAQAKAQAANILNRMNDAGNPMPPAGLVMFEKRELVRIWRASGAN